MGSKLNASTGQRSAALTVLEAPGSIERGAASCRTAIRVFLAPCAHRILRRRPEALRRQRSLRALHIH
jgi:hypothetical protein